MAVNRVDAVTQEPNLVRAWSRLSAAALTIFYLIIIVQALFDHVTRGRISNEAAAGMTYMAFVPALPVSGLVSWTLEALGASSLIAPFETGLANVAWFAVLSWALALFQWSWTAPRIVRAIHVSRQSTRIATITCWFVVLVVAVAFFADSYQVVARYGYWADAQWQSTLMWSKAGIAAAAVVLVLVMVLRGGWLGALLVVTSPVIGGLAAFGVFVLVNCGACGSGGLSLAHVFYGSIAYGASACFCFVRGITLLRQSLSAASRHAI
jgi:hypothetical protein